MSGFRRGADLFAESLVHTGVDTLFALSGNQIMPIFDAVIDHPMRLIHVRHEAAAVHMADAWGRLTGEPGIALVTAGPGFANTISALYVALAAESPLILFSGHAPVSESVTVRPFQKMSQDELAAPVTKSSWTVRDVSELAESVARARQIALSGRPGPVHVALPVNLLQARSPADRPPAIPTINAHSRTAADEQDLDQVTRMLSNSLRPLILTGPAMLRGESKLTAEQAGQRLHVPVVGMESPRGINDPRLGAFAELLPDCDFVILAGKRLDFTLPLEGDFAIRPNCPIVQLDWEETELEESAAVLHSSKPGAQIVQERKFQAIHADPALFLERMQEHLLQPQPERSQWCDRVRNSVSFRPAEWSSGRQDQNGALDAATVGRAVQRFLSQDDRSVFISDGGEFGQWMQATVEAPFRLINGPSGAIGSALPFATAARLSRPDSRIVAALGDGTFGFQPFEFDTARRYALPFIAVVGNDSLWNAEYQIQLRQYGKDRARGCELLPIRYDQVAESLGGYGIHVEHSDQLDDALTEAHASRLPACIHVPIHGAPAPIICSSNS